jgi:hypothetical protein
MTLTNLIKHAAEDAFKKLFPDAAVDISMIQVNQTKPEFTGDYTHCTISIRKAIAETKAGCNGQTTRRIPGRE